MNNEEEMAHEECCSSDNCRILTILACFGTLVSLGTFIGLTATFAPAHLAALSYVNGTCTVVSASYDDERETCHYGRKSNSRSSFPCLKIIVEYKGNDGKKRMSLLHENEHVSTQVPRVSLTISTLI